MNYRRQSLQKGFTLIELMVVITIIGLLASTVLASLANSRKAARDVSRVQAVKELQKALELYRNDNGGSYPCATAMPTCTSGAAGVTINAGTVNTVTTALATYFVPTLETFMNSAGAAGMAGSPASVLYRPGSSSGNNLNPITSTYTILIRREQAVGALPANSWCSVSSGAGHSQWNNTTLGQYPPCY